MSEPSGITAELPNYKSALSRAFNFYNQNKDKKDARVYLKTYVKQHKLEIDLDRVSDKQIDTTSSWLAKLLLNGNQIKIEDIDKLHVYLKNLVLTEPEVKEVEVEKVARPTIQDYMQDKIAEVVGELEGHIDAFIKESKELDLYAYLQGNNVPKPYCANIDAWVRKRSQEFIEVYQSDDKELKEAYSFITRRQLANLIKMLGSFVTDIERYTQFKKANRKPRVKKAKPASMQVAKLNYKKEDTELGLKSVNPAEIVGASQVWVYNTKYKRLAAYRSDSALGIQVKGSTLQNYDPDMSEQKSIRRPEIIVKRVLTSSKVQLRKFLSDIETKEFELTGRINDECIIVRVIK
jgi:hypothetical protein